MRQLVGSVLTFALAAGVARGDGARIVAGPDVLASRDGGFPHVELMVAANPRDHRNLLGGAITFSRPDGGSACKAYASFDGGGSWLDSSFPELNATGGGDPQVAFTPAGTALFAALNTVKDEVGRTRAALIVHRSEDGGRTWARAVDLGYSYDHPQIAVDQTTGAYAGRVYIGALYGGREYILGVFRSTDDGRSFIGPVRFVDGGGAGVNVTSLVVLSDGTLVATYADFPIDPEKRKTVRQSGLWAVSSKDGGVTFSKPVRIGTQTRATNPDAPENRLLTFNAYAADSSSGRFRDRIYGVWSDIASGRARLQWTSSSDQGRTWKPPVPLDPSVPAGAHQYQPAIAVNGDGTVAVAWFDTRDGASPGEYSQYFTASVDGGETFLAPVRVSSQPTQPLAAGNLLFSPKAWQDQKGSLRLPLLSAATRWGHGGDYMGLAADARGAFHPFWADSRTGAFQAWTATVRVERAAAETKPGPPPAAPVAADLNADVDFVIDPSSYDPATRELQLPVRLRNRSDRPIFKPLTVEVRTFGSGMGEEWKENAPIILNASNGKPGDGATFDYSPALAGLDTLAPDGQTAAVVWRMRLADVQRIPDMHVKVTGGRIPSERAR
jgi:hypothetical protein